MSIIEKIIPALAGSAQIVVHSPTSEVSLILLLFPPQTGPSNFTTTTADPLTMSSFPTDGPRNRKSNDDRAFHAPISSLARPDASGDEWDGAWRLAIVGY
jgi:hypothetical protein